MPIGHVVLKIYVPCKNFDVPSQYLYKPCKAYVYCWKNKYMPWLKNHVPSRARHHKSLCALGQDLHAPGTPQCWALDPLQQFKVVKPSGDHMNINIRWSFYYFSLYMNVIQYHINSYINPIKRACWCFICSSDYPNMMDCTVQCCYNAVNFLPNPHKRHPIACPLGEVWDVFCGFRLSFIFCLSHHSDVCNIMLYWTAL